MATKGAKGVRHDDYGDTAVITARRSGESQFYQLDGCHAVPVRQDGSKPLLRIGCNELREMKCRAFTIVSTNGNCGMRRQQASTNACTQIERRKRSDALARGGGKRSKGLVSDFDVSRKRNHYPLETVLW